MEYDHKHDDDHLKIEFKMWFGLIKYKLDIPLIKLDEDSPSIIFTQKVKTANDNKTNKANVKKFTWNDFLQYLHNVKEMLIHVVGFYKIFQRFLKKVQVKEFYWSSTVGIGDAALTGMVTGAVWAIKGSIVGFLTHYLNFKIHPTLVVIPHFQQSVTITELKCMFQFRIGNAMFAGIKLLKFWKGGRPKFKAIPNLAPSESKIN